METKSYTIVGEGLILGFIYITSINTRLKKCIAGTIIPVERNGKIHTDMDFKLILEMYKHKTGDTTIHGDLLQKANIDKESYESFQIIEGK